jgi:hypothetical protein
VILGCAASIVEPAPTHQTLVDSATDQTHQPVGYALSGHSLDALSPALRTSMPSPFLYRCHVNASPPG